MTSPAPRTDRSRSGAVVALALGALAVVGATIVGWNGASLDTLVTPPPLLRAALVGGSVALGVVLLGRSVGRLAEAGEHDVPGAHPGRPARVPRRRRLRGRRGLGARRTRCR